MVSSSCLFNAFSEILLPERSLVEGQKLQQTTWQGKKKVKRKKKIDKNRKDSEVVGRFIKLWFVRMHLQKSVKHNFFAFQEPFE